MISAKMLLEMTKDLKVLYVEDDEELCLATKGLLELYFEKVDIAVNGQLGLEKFKEFKEESGSYYDIVMTDINMPVLNGLKMSEEIYKLHDTQSIVILTAHNSAEYLLESIGIGIDGFLTKPLDNDQLFKTIFKISQALNDHKMIKKYMQKIEELEMELAKKNR
jgi:YesN/AraC family two-component response regulator